MVEVAEGGQRFDVFQLTGVPKGSGQQALGVRHHQSNRAGAQRQDRPPGRQAEAGRHAERAEGQMGHCVRQISREVREPPSLPLDSQPHPPHPTSTPPAPHRLLLIESFAPVQAKQAGGGAVVLRTVHRRPAGSDRLAVQSRASAG